MSAGQIAVLVASVACVAAVAGLLVSIRSLRGQVDRLRLVADELRRQTVPLVADAHRVVDQAATEMERVGAVLDSTESVHATVDSASRLAYRAFANPVVKVLAVRAGAATGIRRLASGGARSADHGRSSRASANGAGSSRASADGAGSSRASANGAGSSRASANGAGSNGAASNGAGAHGHRNGRR